MGGSTSKINNTPEPPYSVSIGNWSKYVKESKSSTDYSDFFTVGKEGIDPAPGCDKTFSATYRCGYGPTKSTNVPAEARGKIARLDCTKENVNCSSYRLTLNDDGNMLFSKSGKTIWTSNTNKTGLKKQEYEASNGKYGRNYLNAGEFLSIGDFIGSPSGNCYLMMTNSGIVLYYDVSGCTMKSYNVGYGNSASDQAVYAIPKTKNANVGKRGYVTFGGQLKSFAEPFTSSIDKKENSGDAYFDLGQYKVNGHDIESVSGTTVDKCKTRCSSLKDCHGFFIHNDGTCYLKNDGMYPNGLRIATNDGHLYTRSKSLGNPAFPHTIEGTSASKWNLYPDGGKVTSSTLSEMSAITREEHAALKKSEAEMLRVQKKLYEKINKISREDAEVSSKLREVMEKYKDDMDVFNPTQTETIALRDDIKQLKAMTSESKNAMLNENTKKIVWSIVAILMMIVVIKTLRR